MRNSKRSNYLEEFRREKAKLKRKEQNIVSTDETKFTKLERNLRYKSVEVTRDYQIIRDQSKNKDPLYQFCIEHILPHHYFDHTEEEKNNKKAQVDQMVEHGNRYLRVIQIINKNYKWRRYDCEKCLELEKKFQILRSKQSQQSQQTPIQQQEVDQELQST